MNTHVTDLYEHGKFDKSWTFYRKFWKDLNEKYIQWNLYLLLGRIISYLIHSFDLMNWRFSYIFISVGLQLLFEVFYIALALLCLVIRCFSNVTLLPLPPYSPELNPVEQLWQQIKQRFLSNTTFQNYDDTHTLRTNVW
jgi:hypothetical protein